jgi:hypothetical protein
MFERQVIDGGGRKNFLAVYRALIRCFAALNKAKGCVSSESSPDPYISRVQYIGEMPQPGIAIIDRWRLFLSGNALCGH